MNRTCLVRFLLVCALLVVRSAPGEETQRSDAPERLQFTEDDLPKEEKDPAGPSEIDDFARRRGFNYVRVTRRAARGETKALKQFFDLTQDVDGAGASRIGEFRPPSITFSATTSSQSF